MKTKIAVLAMISIILASCGTEPTAQETEVVTETPIEVSINEVPMLQESITTEEPIATATPTEVPTETPLACVPLLAPANGTELPITGKVTFSWTPMEKAANYVLNFLLPSGATVSSATDQPFRDRYMEAFVTGGEYQWQVTAQDIDGNKVCVSEVFTFDKPTYELPQKPKGGDNEGNSGDSVEPPPECPPWGCDEED